MIITSSDRIGDINSYYFARKLAQIAEMEQAGERIINLGIGSPDLSPPQAVLNSLVESSARQFASKYQPYRGIPDLRQAFAEWYDRFFDVSLEPDSEILPLIGSKEGIMHVAMSFLQAGDKALVPNPGYPAYQMCTRIAGAEAIPYDLDAKSGWKPDLSKLADQDLSACKLMWLNYPHMPTGATADHRFFEKLVEFAHNHNLLLCHDNPYAFILNDHPLSLLSIDGAKQLALELNSLSKSHNMAGWRIGCLAARADYINTIMRFKSNMDSGMFRPVQEAAVVALSQGYEWYQELNVIYRIRRMEAHKIMDMLDCRYDPESAGLFVWGRIPNTFKNAETYSEMILQHAKVFITPGHIFGTNGKNYLRISLCSEVSVFREAASQIEKIIEKQSS